MPLVSRTRATLRSAEFGFFGVWVYTRVQTPRFCGQDCSAGLAVLYFGAVRPLRTSWLNVGTLCSSFVPSSGQLWTGIVLVNSRRHSAAPLARNQQCRATFIPAWGLGSHSLPILPRQAP